MASNNPDSRCTVCNYLNGVCGEDFLLDHINELLIFGEFSRLAW
jgi:hypothetical protein